MTRIMKLMDEWPMEDPNLMMTEKTSRGFKACKGFDTHFHGKVSVIESSIAFKGPHVWVFTKLAYSNTPEENPPSLHLSLEDAEKLRDDLSAFIHDAKSGLLTEKPLEPEES